MTYLSLDLSKRRTGFAFWRPGMERAFAGHWVLGSEYTCDGEVYCRLHGHLLDLHRAEAVEHCYLEQPIHPASVSGHTNLDTLRVLAGLAAHVHSFAAARRVRTCMEINIASWRRDFIGSQKRGTGRAAFKALTIERCRQLGFDPRCDDEADAIGLLDYALEAHRGILPPWRAGEVLRPPLGMGAAHAA